MHRHQTTVSMTQSTQTAHRGSWGWKRQTAAYDHPPARHSAPSTASIGFRTPAGDAASDDDARMEAKGVEASGRSLINTWGRMDGYGRVGGCGERILRKRRPVRRRHWRVGGKAGFFARLLQLFYWENGGRVVWVMNATGSDSDHIG